MTKSIKYILTIFVSTLFLSCSQADNLYNEYVIEIERTNTNSTNDSTNNGQTKKDTLFLSYEKYMSLSPTISSGQGAACYDKYFIQCYNGNSAIEIYDLEEKNIYAKSKILNLALTALMPIQLILVIKNLRPMIFFPCFI